MNNNADFIEVKLPAKPEYVGVVRLTVSGIANRMGYTYDDIEDIKIAVAEACTNVVNHAYEDEAEDGNMTVCCGVYCDRIEIMIADDGKSFNLDHFKEQLGPVTKEKPISKLSEGGLGLFLIDSLMDRVEINNESGVAVVMTKFLQRNGVEQYVNGISTSAQ